MMQELYNKNDRPVHTFQRLCLEKSHIMLQTGLYLIIFDVSK